MMISREVAASERQEEYPAAQRIEVGPTSIEAVQLCRVHELAQYRQEYDEAGIEELARSMVKNSGQLEQGIAEGDYPLVTAALDLGTPLIINRVDRLHIDQFLHDHADHYQQGVECVPFSQFDDTVDISGSGHRRRRALILLAKWYDFDPERIYAKAAIYHNLSFEEMLGKQFRENVSERPPRIDEAKSIDRYYQQKLRAGEKPTYRSVANFYCVDEKVVARALAFASLPDEVKSYVEQDILSYNLVARFRQLADVQGKLYDTKDSPEPKDIYVKNELLVMAMRLTERRLEGKSLQHLDEILTAQIQTISMKLSGTQDALFFMEEQSSAERRKRSSTAVAARAIALLQLLDTQDELTTEQRIQIQAFTGDAQILASPSSEVANKLF